MNQIQLLNIILVVIIGVIVVLGLVAILIIVKSRTKKAPKDAIKVKENGIQRNPTTYITRDGKEINSIYQFMEFDDIVDNMIVRKNRQQYVMVLDCKGINYDLLSQTEKEAVEAGFMELLNTLRYPIQLYVQTRTFNLKDLIAEYQKRIDEIHAGVTRIDGQIIQARKMGDSDAVAKLITERRKRENTYEYAVSIQDYTKRMSESQNILQQKTYIIISYFITEYGDVSKYSKEEQIDIAFSELYTRAQTIIRALTSAEVTGKVLSSEELMELLYVAYNKDESEIYRLKEALNSSYNRLYSTAKDVMQEREERLKKQIESEASKLAAQSMIKADKINRDERQRRIKERAREMVDEYKNTMSKPLYDETKRQIDQAEIKNDKPIG